MAKKDKMNYFKLIKYGVLLLAILIAGGVVYKQFVQYIHRNEILKQVITHLESDSRVAEVLVTGVNYDENTGKAYTMIKFLEYDVDGKPLKPKYYTFSGNIIQFQSLVIRFEDVYVRRKDKLKGKSAYLFWKVFLLDGEHTQEYVISELNQVPHGYKLEDSDSVYERELWEGFWKFALDPKEAQKHGIKNVQIEAPGTMFVPGHLYTIKIEHDGGLRIDSRPLSPILKGEQVLESGE